MTDASDIFLKIHNRLQSIINCDYRLDEEGCVQPSEIFNPDFNEDILRFEIAGKSLTWKESATMMANKIEHQLSIIGERTYRIFDNLCLYWELEKIVEKTPVVDKNGEIVKNKDGTDVTVEEIFYFPHQKKVNEAVRRLWYRKLFRELTAYNDLIEQFGSSRTLKRLCIDQKTAAKIGIIKCGKNSSFIHSDSLNDFELLLTSPELSFQEINSLKIKIGCVNNVAAYVFFLLREKDIINLSYADIENYGCFYNNDTVLIEKNLTSYLAKFNKGSDTELYSQLQIDIGTAIDNILIYSKNQVQ